MIAFLYLYCFAPAVLALIVLALVVAVRWRPINDGARHDFRVERCANAHELLSVFNPGYEGMLYLLSHDEWRAQQKSEINPEAVRK